MANSAPVNDQRPANSTAPDSREHEDGFWARERLVFFSDAVIAIAMTLLALDLPVPKGETDAQVWDAFVDLLPREYLFFVISFLVIARFWRSHHVFFTEATRVDTGLIRLNLWCLLLIVLVPFATRVLSEDGDFRLGVGLYAATIASIAISYVL